MMALVLYTIRDESGNVLDLECTNSIEALHWYEDEFWDQCVRDNERGWIEEDITLISFIYDDYGEMKTLMEEVFVVDYNYGETVPYV